MDIIDTIILGIIQGLTEFLPVSSSGHLELGKAILGDNSIPEESLLFTIILHFATALSTIVVFRKEVMEILKGLFQFRWNDETRFSLKIIVSMIPAVFVGLFFEEQLEQLFGENIQLVGFMLLITALLLFLADRAKDTSKNVTYNNAFIIGVSQAIAMLPGISRSGSTISTSVLLGIDKNRAARFSFLMVVPLIFGSIAKEAISGKISYDSQQFTPLAIGFVAAFISGLLACTWMIKLVRNSKLTYFAVYCLIVGAVAIVYSFLSN
ncbi:undecaprenyl-diphosphate phosphatase [Sinomicrobium weinanense]|uniref:Undecaprenyl-diphosphatase n=1 Tax=Sinomicrobium weinanense TaxID=2842200 RepID=A0A926JUC1_9FLAO|nr:undecaprenyl-diphosphate phosphatase [Sinomicrobium weinanense]MBC9797474.1 undecaprenyl-diphosphate phosphatase [Sinomicrobium weinanense]MBU3124466.1 undecaprenyl-diphosphate phosphatase [Sinomicrobium weinanense]